jgi:hypothetical protein
MLYVKATDKNIYKEGEFAVNIVYHYVVVKSLALNF